MKKKFLSFLLLGVLGLSLLQAQESGEKWYSNIFVQGGAGFHFPPGELSEYVKGEMNIRGGVGYSFQLKNNFSVPVYLESGFIKLKGTNPMVLNISAVPVSVYGGFMWSPFSSFSCYLSGGCGYLFSTVEHYASVIDMITEKLSVDNGSSFMVNARCGMDLDLLSKSVAIYVEGGIDLILETDGPIPLPELDFGIRIFPDRINSLFKMGKTVTVTDSREVTEYFADRTILFEPESIELSNEALASLEKVGNHMKRFPSVKLELTGYAAPYGTKKEQLEMAQKRSEVVAQYLKEKCSVGEGGIVIRKSKVASEDSRDSEGELIQLRSVVCHVFE